MELRPYKESDLEKILLLFYETVHSVNAADYNKEQLDAWAPLNPDTEKWGKTLRYAITYVATENGTLLGFGSIDKSGFLHYLFVNKNFLRKKTATALCDKLEKLCPRNIVTHSSITAKPFFEKRGYIVIKEQTVERFGVELRNYVMEKPAL